MSIEIAYKNGMLPRATFELALEDVRSLLDVESIPGPMLKKIKEALEDG